MKLRIRAALAAICGSLLLAGCGKTDSEASIPSLNDPVSIDHAVPASTAELDSDDPIGRLPEIPGSPAAQPLSLPEAASDSP